MVNIDFISLWAQGIIVAVIVVSILEMVISNTSSAKYIKVVMGIFILFTIISPIINKFSKKSIDDVDFNSYIETSANENIGTNISVSNEDIIRKMYEDNLKIDITTKIAQKGYSIGSINLEILNNNEYTLNKIDIKIIAKEENSSLNTTSNVTTIVENIENIKIQIGGSSNTTKEEESIISESEKRKLKEYLSSVYEVKEQNILIN